MENCFASNILVINSYSEFTGKQVMILDFWRDAILAAVSANGFLYFPPCLLSFNF